MSKKMLVTTYRPVTEPVVKKETNKVHVTVDGHDWYVEETKGSYPKRWLTVDSEGNRFRFVEANEDHHDPECVSYPLDVNAEWEREALESVIRFRNGDFL